MLHDPTNQVWFQMLRNLVHIIEHLQPCNLKYQLIVWYNFLHSIACFERGLTEPIRYMPQIPTLRPVENLEISTNITNIDIDHKVLTLLSVDKLIKESLETVDKCRSFPLDWEIIQLLCSKIICTMENDPEIAEAIQQDIVEYFCCFV